MLKYIIVDDEYEAYLSLKSIIERSQFSNSFQFLAYASNTIVAENLIQQYNPNLVFLDIEMPSENAFQFLERIDNINFSFVFVTAYDQFAIKAIKINAFDYILKPININEIDELLYKLVNSKTTEELTPISLKSRITNIKSSIKGITIHENQNIFILEFNDILFIEAQGQYSKITYSDQKSIKTHIYSKSLLYLEDLLPEEIFFRVHRSSIVNCNRIRNLQKTNGKHFISIFNYTIEVSRRNVKKLIEYLQRLK